MKIKEIITICLLVFIVKYNYAQTDNSVLKSKDGLESGKIRYLGLGYNLSMGLSGDFWDNHILNIYLTERPNKKKYILPYYGLGLGYFSFGDEIFKQISLYYGLNFGIQGKYVGAEFSSDLGLINTIPQWMTAAQFRAHFSLNSGKVFKNSQLSIGLPFAYPVLYFGPYGGGPFMGVLDISYRMTINKNGH